MRAKTCEICGKRAARYICKECGREACQICFEPATWICLDCYSSLREETSPSESFLWSTPFKLFLLGFVLMFAGIIVMIIAAVLFGTSIDAGAIIWVFPLPPIGFGTGSYVIWVILLSFALTVFSLVLFIILRKAAR